MPYGDKLVQLLVHLLSVLGDCQAVKNFIFRENWVGSEVNGMKIAFFVIFNSTWTHIMAQKGTNMEFFKKKLIFNQ